MENEADAIILPRTEDLVGEEQDLENPVGPTVNEEVGEGNDPEDQVEPRHNTDQASTSSTIPTVNEEVGFVGDHSVSGKVVNLNITISGEGNGQAELPPIPHHSLNNSKTNNYGDPVVGEGQAELPPIRRYRKNPVVRHHSVDGNKGSSKIVSVGHNSVSVGKESSVRVTHIVVDENDPHNTDQGWISSAIQTENEEVGEGNDLENPVEPRRNTISTIPTVNEREWCFGEKSLRRRLKGNRKLGSDHEDDVIDDV